MSKRLGGIINRLQIQSLLFMAFKRVPLCMVVTLGQQYNIGAKPTVILYTYTYYIDRHAGTPEKQRKQKHCRTSSNMVVIIYRYILRFEDKATTWYYSIQLIEVINTYAWV